MSGPVALTSALSNYRMPQPQVGDIVHFYPLGEVSESRVNAAIVTKVRAGSVELHVFGGNGRDGVKHVSDPRLKVNVEQRENGAWDFRPVATSADVMQRLDDLTLRVTQLEVAERERDVDGVKGAASDKKHIGFAVLWEKRRACQAAGRADFKNMTHEECDEFLASLEQQPA